MQIDAHQTRDPVIHDTQFVQEHPTVLRVMNLALPLLVMVPRARFVASMGLGGYQVYCLSRDCRGSKEAIRLVYVTSILGLQAFRPAIAAVIQTLLEFAINTQDLRRNPSMGKASLRFMRSLFDTLALRWGGSSLLIGAMTLQIVLELMESKEEFKQGRRLEGVAHLLFSAIRGYQLAPHVKQAKRDWFGRELTQEDLYQILEKKQLHEGRFDFNKALEEGNYKSTLKRLDFSRPEGMDAPLSFSQVDFRNVTFEQCGFSDAHLMQNIFDRVVFKQCHFGGAIFNESYFRNSQFLDSSLRSSYLHSCQIENVTFERCDLFEASFCFTRAKEARLLNCQLTDCLLLDAKKDFKIEGGTPHTMTRPIVGISWNFKREGFGMMTDAIAYALEKEETMVLRVESSPEEVDPMRLEEEMKIYLATTQERANIPQGLLAHAKEGSEIAKVLKRASVLLEHVDAFVLPGGVDIEPELYGEVRALTTYTEDDFRRSFQELALLQRAKEMDKQVLGICRGAQLINVFHGGTLHQHVEGHFDAMHEMKNRSSHPLAEQLIGGNIAGVSRHHQAIKEIGKGLELILEAEGVPKLVMNQRFIASQFHPEAYLWMEEGENREKNRNFFRVFKNSISH
ncbi:MAG: gamma-glutamyl-gamma-aminobutyrate hydrolase family protein [Verrucomicrobia bacterium]|nr:gamma-glutamyl-gamma-aminobutyrate hydrolase family protein [Verrucomicrobiota bacterium]